MSKLNTFLAGIRVIDLSRHLPGPLATLLLADMGAEVTKIEPPDGDELRTIGPPGPNGRSVYFDAINAGKTTCRMDLADPEQRQAVVELVKTADVLVESFRPGVMDRLGIGYPALRRLNPRLVHCSLNGFGKNGPRSQQAGHDANYLALAGVLFANGLGSRPLFFDPPIADCTASLMAVIAILGALQARQTTGSGCEIDLALADAVMPLQTFHLAALAVQGKVPQRERGLLNGGAAYYQIYETADGRHVTLCAIEPKFWAAFCRAAGREEWISRQDEPLPQERLKQEVAALFGSMTLAECLSIFEPADCCVAPVIDLKEALDFDHHMCRGLVQRDPSGGLQALFPAYVDGEPPELRPPLREMAHEER